MKKKSEIIIQDWAGNILFIGHHDDPKVLEIMEKNDAPNDDIFVAWKDPNDERNVYEFINF
ncbi:MAG: hypothetical protein ACKOX6_11240 [Bdellovibrio sp.]